VAEVHHLALRALFIDVDQDNLTRQTVQDQGVCESRTDLAGTDDGNLVDGRDMKVHFRFIHLFFLLLL
jgi:hypothetical protein